MNRLENAKGLFVHQLKEMTEVLTGFEMRNRYEVFDDLHVRLFLATEREGSMLLRWFLRSCRPFTVDVTGDDGRTVIQVTRPFRFYFHEVEVTDIRGHAIGTVERRWSLLHRLYVVRERTGHELCVLHGPLLHPWTFEIRQDGVEVGKIAKKWSGLLKESFTDADNFGVLFPAGWNVEQKALLLGAVFLIDFVHFENRD